jgi:hypothetical protein
MTADREPLVLGSRTDAGPDRFEFHTADGVAAADAFCPGELLALDGLWDRELGRLRTVGARYGVVGVVLAERATGAEQRPRAPARPRSASATRPETAPTRPSNSQPASTRSTTRPTNPPIRPSTSQNRTPR